MKKLIFLLFLVYFVAGLVLFQIANRESWTVNLTPFEYDHPSKIEWLAEVAKIRQEQETDVGELNEASLNGWFDWGKKACFHNFHREPESIFDSDIFERWARGGDDTSTLAVQMGWNHSLKVLEQAKKLGKLDSIREKMTPPTFWQARFIDFIVFGFVFQVIFLISLGLKTSLKRKGSNDL